MIITHHKELAAGRWFALTLMQQLGNIGSEVARAAQFQNKNKVSFDGATDRALELFDLTLSDNRWRGRRFEIARARELFCAAVYGGESYNTTLNDLDRYFFTFACAK